MKVINNNDELEIDCYLKILEYFQKEKVDRETTEIWKNQSLIELMNLLERTKNRTLVANAIILILTLFEDLPPDIYNNRGVHVKRISDRDKKSLIKELKDEFLPN